MKALRKPLSLFMAMLMCLGIFAGTGTTAFAAGETMTTYMVEFPRQRPQQGRLGTFRYEFPGRMVYRRK